MSTVLAWTAISWVALAVALAAGAYLSRRNLARQRATRVVIYLAPIRTRDLAYWPQLQTAVDLARRDFTDTTW